MKPRKQTGILLVALGAVAALTSFELTMGTFAYELVEQDNNQQLTKLAPFLADPVAYGHFATRLRLAATKTVVAAVLAGFCAVTLCLLGVKSLRLARRERREEGTYSTGASSDSTPRHTASESLDCGTIRKGVPAWLGLLSAIQGGCALAMVHVGGGPMSEGMSVFLILSTVQLAAVVHWQAWVDVTAGGPVVTAIAVGISSVACWALCGVFVFGFYFQPVALLLKLGSFGWIPSAARAAHLALGTLYLALLVSAIAGFKAREPAPSFWAPLASVLCYEFSLCVYVAEGRTASLLLVVAGCLAGVGVSGVWVVKALRQLRRKGFESGPGGDAGRFAGMP